MKKPVFVEIPSHRDEMAHAIAIAQRLERRERASVSSVAIARQRLADKLRVGRGTVETLIRGRLKRIDAAIRDRLHALLIRELEAEIARLSNELQMARQSGLRLDSDQVREIDAHLARAKAILNGNDQ